MTSQVNPDSMSGSQSLSSARKRHFQEIDQAGGQGSRNYHNADNIVDDQSYDLPNPKRSRPSPRSSEVSLREFDSLSGTGRRRHGQTTSSASNCTRVESRRSSRFTEGSMRDRVSECPPDSFTHDESASDRSASMQRERISEDNYKSFDSKVEAIRPLGLRRLGKTLTTALKPTSIFPRPAARSRERDRPRQSQEQPRWDDQRMRAEKAYAELQKNQVPSARRMPKHISHASTSRLNLGEPTEYQALLKRNSYADRIGDRVDANSNRNRPIAPKLKSEQEVNQGSNQSPSVMPNLDAEPRASCPTPDSQVVLTIENSIPQSQLPTPPALENPLLSLKKVKSYFHLPETKSRSISPLRSTTVSPEKGASPSKGSLLKESPSKRDLKKQKRLMSKISNLEDKLAHAKRSLRLTIEERYPVPDLLPSLESNTQDPAPAAMLAPSLNSVLPDRPIRFIPGSLPTVPSERLFNPVDRAIHEDLLRRKGSFVEAEPFKMPFQKKLTKPHPVGPDLGSITMHQLCPTMSSARRGSIPNDLKAGNSKITVSTVHAQRAGSDSDSRNEDYAHRNASTYGPGSVNWLAERETGAAAMSMQGKAKSSQDDFADSEDIENRSSTLMPRMILSPTTLHCHQKSDLRALSEATVGTLDQRYNEGLQVRRNDWNNRKANSSPQKLQAVIPNPIVPKGINGRHEGKENRTQETRLSGVREEEDFTWDEDVF